MEKRVAFVIMLLTLFPLISFPAVIPSASDSPGIKRFFNFPVNDTLKKICASHFIAQFGCGRVDEALRTLKVRQISCPHDIHFYVQKHILTIKNFLFSQVGSCAQEAQIDKLQVIILDAVQQKRIDILKVIIEYMYVQDRIPAVCMLAANGYTQSCRHLLENGEDVNRANILGKTPLMCAAQYGKQETVELLLEKNADQNLKTVCNKNAMEIAQDNGYPNIALFIIQKKVKQAQDTLNSLMTD